MDLEEHLKILLILVYGLFIGMTILWGFLYLKMIQKFKVLFEIFDVLTTGIGSNFLSIAQNQQQLQKNLSEEHRVIMEKMNNKKEFWDETSIN